MKILHIDSSILAENSITHQLSAALVEKARAKNPNAEVIYHDLASAPLPHLSGAYMAALTGAAGEHSPELAHDLAESGKVLDEFIAADLVIIGAPMYNFSIPSQLKAWLDRLAVPGKTFRYTEAGPQGLLDGKKVVIASARGSSFTGTAIASLDHQESYLNAFFGFLGITDVEYVRAEGVAISPENRTRAVSSALEHIAHAA
jgi:FMN-dependent NADH-azoreductase